MAAFNDELWDSPFSVVKEQFQISSLFRLNPDLHKKHCSKDDISHSTRDAKIYIISENSLHNNFLCAYFTYLMNTISCEFAQTLATPNQLRAGVCNAG